MAAGSQVIRVFKGTAKPILSNSFTEARRRALNLYRAWYREVRAPEVTRNTAMAVFFFFFIVLVAQFKQSGCAQSRFTKCVFAIFVIDT